MEEKLEWTYKEKIKILQKNTYIAKKLCKEDQAIRVLHDTKELHYVRVTQLLPQSKFLQKESPAISKLVELPWIQRIKILELQPLIVQSI